MNRVIGHQLDLLGGPEVTVWSAGKPPREKREVQPRRARKTDPSTSHDAAAAAKDRTKRVAATIEDAIRRFGPMTSHEIASRTGLSLVTVSPMIKPMRVAGVLKDTGGRRERRSVWGIA